MQTLRIKAPDFDLAERASLARSGRLIALKLPSIKSKSRLDDGPVEIPVRRSLSRDPDCVADPFCLKKAVGT